MFETPKILPASDRTILIQFGNKISEDIHRDVLHYSQILAESFDSLINNISPGYCSILIRLQGMVSMNQSISLITKIFNNDTRIDRSSLQTVNIPVCYDGEFSPDMKRVMEHTGYSRDEIIDRHVSGSYLVYFIGFTPGFPYMGGMDTSLETPRQKTPRTIVPAGSVAIGGKQTGIYPIESPGGWNIIGKTYLPLFDWNDINSNPIKMGYRIQFHAISKKKFDNMDN